MIALDAINRRMSRDTVFYAAAGIRRDWAMARNMKSQHFTTDWQELLQVFAHSSHTTTHPSR
jgi:DNA polymerase V